MPQVKIWVLKQLCAKQASKVKHLIYLRPRLDGTRPFNAHVVDGLAGADAQAVDQVAGYQDAYRAPKTREREKTAGIKEECA